MNEVEVFNFEANEVRTVLINQEVWFVGKDVADTLGYKNGSRDINSHVDEDDKLKYQISTAGQNREQILVNESGVYSLIFGSKLDSAKRFKKWVTSEVLPSIRQHGAYMTESKIEEVLTDPDTLIRLATQLKEERQEKKRLAEQVQIQAPKVEFAETIQQSESNISVTNLAKLMSNTGVNVGRNKLFEYLRETGWLLRDNTPSQKGINRGLFATHESPIKTHYGTQIKVITDVTPKGQEYFIKKLNDYLNEVA
ncbi:phage antirepressor [Leuconostoc pseudomesenteroides]|uniref:phage antirepressor n=1 Tax=Leuconostoc pseudomesenteroides TaxID=33968 RepID=UPI00289EF3B7|nr:phage antirepressor [Leuconostoc pseudomesenteroides]